MRLATSGFDLQRFGTGMVGFGAAAGIALAPVGLVPATIAVAIGGLGLLISRPRLPRLSAWWWALAFVAWCLLAAAVVKGSDAEARPFKSLNALYSWLAFPIGLAAFSRCAWRVRAQVWTLWTCCAAAVLALLQVFVGFDPDVVFHLGGEPFGRVGGFLNGPLTYGAVAALLAPLAIPVHWPKLYTSRTWWFIAVVFGVVITGARLATVALAAGIVAFMSALGGRRRLAQAIGLAALIGVVGIGLFALRVPGRAERMLKGDDGRVSVWAASLAMIGDHPMFGIGGRAGFQKAYDGYYQAWLDKQDSPPVKLQWQKPHAHNLELILASEFGIPAAILNLGMLGAIALTCWRRRHQDPEAFARSVFVLTVWFTAGQLNNLVSQGETSYCFWLVLGWTASPLLMPRVENILAAETGPAAQPLSGATSS